MGKENNQNLNNKELLDTLYKQYGGGKISIMKLKMIAWRKRALWNIVINTSLFLKRLFDIIFSLWFLIMFSPVYLLTILAIKLESPGPAFYFQTRVGKWGKTFKMIKFRSMVMNADKMKDQLMDKNITGGITFKIKDDPRVTKVGKFIRKFSIDELPQFINVLLGDMSIVGPRPPVPREVKEYDLDDRQRLDITPGITCIWQVSGRSDIDFKGQVKLDVQYIQSQSFLSDIKLLLRTIPAVLFGKGAY